jgi:hypothetical protein
MVFKGATAPLTDNTIRGGGVAGIRVGGTVTASDNELEGFSVVKYGPPNYAVWALPGARVTLSRNHISSWRHALYATEATVNADNNDVQDFFQTAFVVINAPQPANVFKNTVTPNTLLDKIVDIQGATGNITKNIFSTNRLQVP